MYGFLVLLWNVFPFFHEFLFGKGILVWICHANWRISRKDRMCSSIIQDSRDATENVLHNNSARGENSWNTWQLRPSLRRWWTVADVTLFRIHGMYCREHSPVWSLMDFALASPMMRFILSLLCFFFLCTFPIRSTWHGDGREEENDACAS